MRTQFLSVNTLFAPIFLFCLGSIFMQIKLSSIQEERNKSSVVIAEHEIQVKRKQVESNNQGTRDGPSSCPSQVPKVFIGT